MTTLTKAEELIAALRPSSWGDHPSDWIFRGQRDAKWRLYPGAFRKDDPWAPFRPPGLSAVVSGWGESLAEQFDVLERFCRDLNDAGIDIPNPIELSALFAGGPTQLLWFPLKPAALTFVALAQHHGIPTRLLDWSRVGLNAAYFAAAGAAAKLRAPATAEKPECLSVWAFQATFADACAALPDASGFGPKLRVVTAPRASNPNLHAQSGLFTESWSNPAAPLDQIVVELLAKLDAQGLAWQGPPPLVRFDLPCSESPKLLRLLADEQVTGARMFPGREGVVMAMRERSTWDR